MWGTDESLESWLGRDVVDDAGELVGVVVDIYDDAATGRPTWLALATDMFGAQVHVVPARRARQRGEDVVVRHTKADITATPSVRAHRTLSPADQQAVITHYGGSPIVPASDSMTPPDSSSPSERHIK